MTTSIGLRKLRAGLAVVFVLTLLAIFAQLCYILWRRGRLFSRRNIDTTTNTTAGATNPYGGNNNSSPLYFSSKELLYFFCWKNQSQIEPNFRSSPTSNTSMEESDIDEFKLLEMYGRSRVLFTIKEDQEKEDNCNDIDEKNKSAEKKGVFVEEESFDDQTTNTGQGGETLLDDDDHSKVISSMVAIVIDDDDDIEVDERESTPFSTPCASPPYYTPTPSPSRDGDEENQTQFDDRV